MDIHVSGRTDGSLSRVRGRVGQGVARHTEPACPLPALRADFLRKRGR
jgi:hypothetical protein